MYRAIEFTLVAETYSTDAIGQPVATETTNTVLGTLSSITRSEWVAAGQAGLVPEYVVSVFFGDYNGESIAILDGVRYGIYRTYLRDDEQVELYLERKGGVVNGTA